MRKCVFLLFIGLTLLSCSKDGVPDPESNPESTPNPVNIRVRNESGVDFTDVFVSVGGGHTFGDVAMGAETDYHLFDYAYHYAYVSLVANGDTLFIQPVDYVGESYLAAGNYTYVLDTMNLDNVVHLFMTCVED